ncbi:MAG: MaoC family dehydratase [Robiginitomaculum sp.]|nr:MaoC family dehydratase [Robiginitomaculum sp.]MDQ7078287.1 MaoC family dehydratase [Robiginitomaculum sp.]
MVKIVSKEELLASGGKDLGHSDWFEIDQERINAFADATLDHQFIHVDPEAAAKTPFGGTIAHGFLTLSMLPYLMKDLTMIPENVMMGVNYGFNSLRFINPVAVNSKIRAAATIKEVIEKKPGQFLVTYSITIEIEGADKPALVAEWLAMSFTA